MSTLTWASTQGRSSRPELCVSALPLLYEGDPADDAHVQGVIEEEPRPHQRPHVSGTEAYARSSRGLGESRLRVRQRL